MCSELSPEQRTSRVPRSWRGFWPWDTGLCHLKQNREARSDLQSTFAYRGGWNNESHHSVSPSHAMYLKCHLSPHTGKASLCPGHGEFDEHGSTLRTASGLSKLYCMPTSTWAPGKWRVNPPSSQFLKVLCRSGRRQNRDHMATAPGRPETGVLYVCAFVCLCVHTCSHTIAHM